MKLIHFPTIRICINSMITNNRGMWKATETFIILAHMSSPFKDRHIMVHVRCTAKKSGDAHVIAIKIQANMCAPII